MIEQQVTVIEIVANKAMCRSISRQGCARCEAGEGCGGGVFNQLFGGKIFQLSVDNELNAQAGDQVILGLPESALTIGSLFLYLVPLLGLLFGAVISDSLLPTSNELWIIAFSVFGLGLGILFVQSQLRKKFFLQLFKPTMLRTLPTVEQFKPEN